MISHQTVMPKIKVALKLEANLVERVDELVRSGQFRSRSQAIESTLANSLRQFAHTRLARESAKLDARQEQRLADEWQPDDFLSA